MANALHFVAAQPQFLSALAGSLQPGGTLLIVEYDIEKAKARWVPYPVSVRRLEQLASAAGFATPVELGRRRSQFGGELYAARLTFHHDRTFAEP